jgi:hypothetical protein
MQQAAAAALPMKTVQAGNCMHYLQNLLCVHAACCCYLRSAHECPACPALALLAPSTAPCFVLLLLGISVTNMRASSLIAQALRTVGPPGGTSSALQGHAPVTHLDTYLRFC